MSRRGRRWGAWALCGLAAALLSGCGIRPTEVPTDFGAAPTRVGCTLPGSDQVRAPAGGEFAVQVYLVCTTRLVTVDRTVTVTRDEASNRVVVARELLDQLKRTPSAAEKKAGYTTEVRSGTTVTDPRAGDPADALRLNTPPDDLSPDALAQIVCTFANNRSATGQDDDVVLGGPGDDPLRDYTCTESVKARPGLIPAPAGTVG